MSQYLTGLNLLDPGVKRYNGGTSTFTMDTNGTTNGTLLWVSGVAQIPGTDYNVAGATITTTTAAPAGTNTVVSLQLFETGVVNTPADNTVTSAKIVDGTIVAADLADDAVTLAKMVAGTDGNIISYDASGNPVAIATGSDGQVLTSTGAGSPPAFEAVSAGFTLAAIQASTSGAAIDFTGIPAGTEEIIVILSEVGMNNQAGGIGIQIRDSGGLETSGYVGSITRNVTNGQSVTTHFGCVYYTGDGAARTNSGIARLNLYDSSANRWVCSSSMGDQNNNNVHTGAGIKSLSAELDGLTVLCVNSATAFDAGAIRIGYR